MQDHGGQGVCIGYSRQYQRQGGGRTIVCHYPVSQTVSHDEAAGADQVLVLDDGQLLDQGKPEEIFSKVEDRKSVV